MAEDGRLQAARRAVQPGNPQVNLDRPAEELLDRDDVVLVRLRAGPGARTGLWWISPGIASRIWR